MIILLMSWSSFSQTVTNDSLKTTPKDTTKVVLSYKVAKLIAKDLIAGDSCKKEVELLNLKTLMILEREMKKDSVIGILTEKNENYESILLRKDEQIGLGNELSEKLNQELKVEKRKTGIYKLGTIAGVTATIILLLTK